MPRLILGSGSPRRRELLAQLGLSPEAIVAPDIDETPHKDESPRAYCVRMAREKLRAIPREPGDVVLCADTTVAVGRRILGKPDDADEARSFLNLMSGRRHRVISAIAVASDKGQSHRHSTSTVRMRRLSRKDVEAYIATGDWQGKAGGYAIQGPAAAFIPWIQGSHSAIVGLPLAETATLLSAAGLRVPA